MPKDNECSFSPDNVGPKGIHTLIHTWNNYLDVFNCAGTFHQHILALSLPIIEEEEDHGFSTGHIRRTYQEVEEGRAHKSKRKKERIMFYDIPIALWEVFIGFLKRYYLYASPLLLH